MAVLETTALHQKAVLYTANGFDDYGEPKVDAAVEIDVRWEIGKHEGISPTGAPIALDSTVVVDREIAIGSAIWLRALADLPSPVTNLRTVIDYAEIPDIKGRQVYRTVSLMKLSDEIPASA